MAKYRLTQPFYRNGIMYKVDEVIDFSPRTFVVDGKTHVERPGLTWEKVEEPAQAQDPEKSKGKS